MAPLVVASGGVIRDIIALTRMATQRAFTRGAERPELVDAEQAIRSLGDDHRLGLDDQSVAMLNALRHGRDDFTPTTGINLELIETRRILHYSGPDGDRFEIHPTLIRPTPRRGAT